MTQMIFPHFLSGSAEPAVRAIGPSPSSSGRRPPGRIKLAHTDTACPHCGGPIAANLRYLTQPWAWRCRKCHCRWSSALSLVSWGKPCPSVHKA